MLVRKLPRQTLFVLMTAALILAACNVGATPAPTIDINAINTAALGTAMAQISVQQTQTALAAPSSTLLPTDTPLSAPTQAAALPAGTLPTVSFNSTPNTTPLAGFTPIGSPVAPAATVSLGSGCNNSAYVADITIPDGMIFQDDNEKGSRPGNDFHKIWRVENTGTCKWDEGYSLGLIGGDDELNPHSVKLEGSSNFADPGETIDVGVFLTAPRTPGTYTATWRMKADNGDSFGTALTVTIEVKE